MFKTAKDLPSLPPSLPAWGMIKATVSSNIKAPLMIPLAELDGRVNASWPEYEPDLKANKFGCQLHMYPDRNDGFHNDSTGRYDKENAELAWNRTVAFFSRHLAES